MNYIRRQRESGIHVGDQVKVLRKAEDNENGWGCGWNSEGMDPTIGHIYTVLELHYREDVGVGRGTKNEEDDNGFWYPYFVLSKIEKETFEKVQVEIGSETLYISKQIAKLL